MTQMQARDSGESFAGLKYGRAVRLLFSITWGTPRRAFFIFRSRWSFISNRFCS